MYNSQYYTCEQIDERLLQGYLDDYNSQTGQSLTKAQFLTKLGSLFSKEGTIDNTLTQIGYYECDTAAGTAAKVITVASYSLFAGGSMKVKFVNKNTANNATLNINSQGAKALYYQGERASSTNSWDEGEVVEIYYDGTSYYANNVKGGSGSGVYDVSKEHPTSGPNSDGKFTLDYILNPSNVNELIPVNKRFGGMSIMFVQSSDNKYVQYRLMSGTFNTTVANWQGIDDEPTNGSKNLVESGGAYNSIESVEYLIDDKQTLKANSSNWQTPVSCYMEQGIEYTVTNIGLRAISVLDFRNNTTKIIGISSSLAVGDSVNITPLTNSVNNFIAFSNGSVAKFKLVRATNKIETLKAENVNQQSQLDNVKQATLQEQKIRLSGGWQNVSYNLMKGMIYTLTKIEGTGSVTHLAAYDANDQLVTVTGFTNLINIGDTCNITVANDAVRIRAYFDGLSVTDIKSNLPTYTFNSIRAIQQEQATQNTEIEKLETSISQLKSFSSSDWIGWRSYSFKRKYSYKITNVSTNANSRVGNFTLRNSSGSVVSYTGTVSNLAPNESAVIVPNLDAVEFNAYFNGGAGKITIEDISLEVAKNLYELNDAVQIQEGYSSKDAIKHTVIVSKTGATGHFSSIADAFASITDSSYTNQYEVQVYPGKYNETDLQVPPYTHTYGLFPNSVVISNEGLTASPVFEQARSSSKLSNLTIESHSGYCIHFDQALAGQALVNSNLVLFHTENNSSAIVGGGAMSKGTKYVWKNCVFRSNYPKSAACHTASGGVNDNTHLIFDSCIFINSSPKVGSVGGNGCDVVELVNCSFPVGVEGLGNWFSAIRNTDDPTLYRLNRYAWNIIGGGNKNLSMWQQQTGKTIGLSADYPITISGSAAEIIFGSNPYINNVKTARLDCTLISEYYIDDSQAGYPPYSALTDVYQLWKRLGDCSTTNKTLTVTVNGVSKTYTFTEDYLTDKTSQADIIAAMQAVLDNVTINTIVQSGYSYENVNTSDIIMIKVTSADILKGEFITHSGAKATSATDLRDIAGVACEDKPIGEYVKVWTSAFRFDTDYADGEYGLDANGALDANAATKIGFIKGYNFYLY